MIGRALLLLAMLWWGCGPAHAQENGRKVALIVANAEYANGGSLLNPRSDGLLVAASLRRAGFESVTVATDQTLDAFKRTLRDFRNRALGAEVALIYYAGHGIEADGRNWLIPTDAILEGSYDLALETIELDRLMESVSGARVRIVILDACRNNPFARRWPRGTRAIERGLAQVDVEDVLVIYAASPGQTATDGNGANSPFAESLARRLSEPDLPIQLLGGTVRDDVLAATGGTQRPFFNASMTGTPIYLVRRSQAPPPLAVPAQAPRLAVDTDTIDAITWQGAVNANSRAGYEEYRSQFPNGRFARLAEQNMQRLASLTPEAADRTIEQRPATSPHETFLAVPPAVIEPPRPKALPTTTTTTTIAPTPAPIPKPARETTPLPLPPPTTAPATPVAGDGSQVDSVAELNRRIQANNDAIVASNAAARQRYEEQRAAVLEANRLSQERYQRELAANEAVQSGWRERVRACQAGDVAKCDQTAALDAESLAVRKKQDDRLDELLAWREGIVLCEVPVAGPAGPIHTCHGPLQTYTGVLETASAEQAVNFACGIKEGSRPLGESDGRRIFGCGYGIHPEDAAGKYPGNRDVAIKFGLPEVAGRGTFHCIRRTSAFCKSA